MLLPLTVAFLSGVVGGSFLPFVPLTVLGILAIAAVALTLLERLQTLSPQSGLVIFGGLLLGVLYWTAFVQLGQASTPLFQAPGKEPVNVVGTVVEPVRHGPDRDVIVLAIARTDDRPDGAVVTGRLRVTWRGSDVLIRQGDRVAFSARLRAPSGLVNPGGFDYGAYLERHGIDAVASVSGPGQLTVLGSGGDSWRWALWYRIDTWRDRIREAAVAALDGPALGIFLGMIIGEPDYLSPDVRDAFMATGTVHILSISGSHLGLIALLAFFIIRRTCHMLPASWLLALSRRITPTRLSAVLTTIPVVFYALLAGSQTATVRSLVMILIFLLAVWLGRGNHLLSALAAAALLVIAFDPRVLFDISFQLSYLSVLAIALVVRRNEKQDERDESGMPSPSSRAGAWIRAYAWMTGGVTLATMPLVAYYFNQVAWLGLVGNLIIVPFAGCVAVPLGLGSAVWLLLAGGDALPMGAVNQAVCELMAGLVHLLSRAPAAEWHVASPAIAAMGAFYLLLGVTLLPDRIKVRRAAAMAAALIALWWLWSPRGWSDGETLRVTFLDVGQGDACVIELPDRQTVLIDGGAAYESLDMGRTVIGPFLWDRGVTRLDHVIATHPQLDHVGGLAWVVEHFKVDHYWGNGLDRSEAFYQRLRASLREHGLEERIAADGQTIVMSGGCTLRVLNPPVRPTRPAAVPVRTSAGSLLNNASVVTKLDCGPHSFLFTADIEAATIIRLLDSNPAFQARVMKVPHHGAKSSLDIHWLTRARIEAAVISVGRSNPYGHPAPVVLDAYEAHHIPMLRTDRDGAVQVTATLASPALQIEKARDSLLQPIATGAGMLASEGHNLKRLWRQWVGK